MPSIHEILKDYWGYQSFRPLQEDIINTVMNGEDCLALLPTGGGKSICFQVPAMAKKGLCLVITPLIALMKDQVENLRRKGITAFSVHTGMSRKEVIATLRTAGNSNCKFLYVSPERLESNLFKEFLPSLGISLIAVDEAHCISQWGYDFRPSYLKIAALRDELPDVPVLALTASATVEVQKDICSKLLFKKNTIFRQSFERPNLSYSVFNVSSKITKIAEILEKVEGTAIVYCRSRKKTKEISDLLNMRNIRSDYYHAGLTQVDRNEKQEQWLKDEVRVMVCTNAFGMGIDKPGVRVVVHADVPDCLENYYQEAGRAGRDGKNSYAVLLCAPNDIKQIKATVDKKFPPQEVIRQVYKGLMNHLQIPSDSGAGNSYELDATLFIDTFEFDAPTVLSVLKTLEQEELVYFNEQVFIQPKIQVIASRERLFEFEKEMPALEPLIKSILRTYEGVIDQLVNVNERSLAISLKTREDEVVHLLHQLHRYRIIDYIPRKDKPQLYLIQNRVKAEDLTINTKRYYDRKKLYEDRIAAMESYVQATVKCRSLIIGNYFGDDEIKDCGICDNCLANKRKKISANDFDELSNQVFAKISKQPCSLNELVTTFSLVPDVRVKEIVHYLLAEQKISVNKSGQLYLKNTSLAAPASKS